MQPIQAKSPFYYHTCFSEEKKNIFRLLTSFNYRGGYFHLLLNNLKVVIKSLAI